MRWSDHLMLLRILRWVDCLWFMMSWSVRLKLCWWHFTWQLSGKLWFMMSWSVRLKLCWVSWWFMMYRSVRLKLCWWHSTEKYQASLWFIMSWSVRSELARRWHFTWELKGRHHDRAKSKNTSVIAISAEIEIFKLGAGVYASSVLWKVGGPWGPPTREAREVH